MGGFSATLKFLDSKLKGKIEHKIDMWPHSDSFLRRAIAISISVKMIDEQVERTISALQKATQTVLL